MSNSIVVLNREEGIGRPLDLFHPTVTEELLQCKISQRVKVLLSKKNKR
jgi:hypothetical protein